MRDQPDTTTKQHKRLGLRLAMWLLLAGLIANLLLIPTWLLVADFIYAELGDPEYVRAYLAYLETGLKTEGLVPLNQLAGKDLALYVAMISVNGLVVAFLCYLIVSRLVTSPLERLAASASSSFQGSEDLPGPFKESGGDELGRLASAMNAMRDRVSVLLDEMATTDAARRAWVAQVSHDLRTPLTALSACLVRAEAKLKEMPDQHAQPMGEVLSAARFDTKRVEELVEDLFEIARLDADGELSREDVPPGQLVQQAGLGFQALAQAEGIRLEQSVASNLPLLWADGHRLARALENLLRNALQHARSHVLVSVAEVDGGVRFVVQDDGTGFVQDVRSSSMCAEQFIDTGSSGIGLTVARSIVEAHGGTLEQENLAGSGARVSFRIPVVNHLK